MTKLQQRAPGRTRRPVLLESATDTATLLQSKPNTWFIIAKGDRSRQGVIAQTGYRIGHGLYQGFEVTPEKPGEFEVKVSTDSSIEDRTADVELFARWVPAAK